MNSIDRQIIEQENIREKYFHDLIIKNDNIKSDFSYLQFFFDKV
jgi:hypothetical protein